MSSIKYPYSEHRDMYLEILKKAEKEADTALIKIIADRLKEYDPKPSVTKDGCRVFSFPAAATLSCGTDPNQLFWKNSQFWQDLVQFLAFLSVSISWFVFFCNLINHQYIK